MRRLLLSALMPFLAFALPACAGTTAEKSDQAEQATGPAGIEFVTVPVPGQDCDSIVLKGTRRFLGRAYVLPQAYVGVDAVGKPLFQVLANADGSYAVRLGLFFPGGRDGDRRADSNRSIRKDCSYSRIREVVNQNTAANEQIGDPSPLLVNYIKVTMPGTEGVSFIGHEGTDILSYVGQDSLVELKIRDEAALRDFVARLRSDVGAQVDFDFVFTAQTSDAFEANVDFRQSTERLDAAFGANVPLDGLMIEGEFRARLARAMQTMDLELYVESNDDAFRQFADRIVEKLMLDNPALAMRPVMPEGLPANNQPQAENGTVPTTNNSQSVVPALVKINVSAALEALKTQGVYRIRLTNIGEVAPRTYTAHTVIRSDFTEPGVAELALYSDDTGGIFTDDVRAGTNLYLVPSARATEDIEYHYQATNFTQRDDLFAREHNMQARFSLLSQHAGDVNYRVDGAAYMYDGWAVNVFNWSFYTWGFEKLGSDFHNRKFHRLESGEINNLNQVAVTFSRLGRTYTFRELPNETTLWDATLEPEHNRVLLRAKSDLGRLKLENKETFATVSAPASNPRAPLHERRYYQDYWSSFGNHKERQVSNVGPKLALPAQRSAVYVKVIPERGDLTAINAHGISVAPRQPHGILHPPAQPQE